MRLNEFSNLNEISRPTWDDATKILSNNGYSQIGHGLHAEVFHKNGSSNIVKLFSNDDDGYQSFIKLVSSHPNQNFPKFVGKMTKINNHYSAIRMEKLNPLTNFPDWFAGTVSVYEDARQETHNKSSMTAEEILSNHYSRHDDEAKLLDLFKKQPDLEKAINLIIDELVINQGRILDLHRQNIMSRNGIWVIIDPIH